MDESFLRNWDISSVRILWPTTQDLEDKRLRRFNASYVENELHDGVGKSSLRLM